MRLLVLVAAAALSGCGAPIAEAGASAPAASPTASPSLHVVARRIADVPPRGIVSPDGKWIAAPEPPPRTKTSYTPAALLYDLDGTLARRIEAPGGSFSWMSDSSGLFVALDAGQRSSTLGIAALATGHVTKTDLQTTGATLSRDGKWIVANHQEGCCMSIRQREIWIAPRSGGPARTLATATSPGTQVIGVVGVDTSDRVIYHDGDRILRVPLGGGTPALLGTIPRGVLSESGKAYRAGDTSPDGMAIVLRTYDPLVWYVIAGGRLAAWDDTRGSIVEDRQRMPLLFYPTPVWAGPHAILVSSATGRLSVADLLDGTRTPLAAVIGAGDRVLAYGGGRMLVARERRALVVDAATGARDDAGIDLGTDLLGTLASALPGGGFILSTVAGTYRID